MFSLLSQRIPKLISLIDAHAFRNLDARLAAWRLKHSPGQHRIGLTHQNLAEELASSREVISRLLKEFECEGLIKLGRGGINMLDPERISHQFSHLKI
ncbi:MAG TPA: helix-turn-helix domain-containing protein [Methyloprofundus sp.]|uniref:Crp/Fnr family transcriptional regulator n=1 Tax=Methyloprofundus sp. TaxID=2020875 RepID=UPI00182551B6|nr:helix-turn-helix domain-containing protein [Methyloprofundus sp.]HIL77313.1 helix-turn-helix domain-containing protein [Methylococcales bacterium]